MERKIRNAQDLADYWGCDADEEALSRVVYKYTDCGAWLALVAPAPVKTRQTWVAHLSPSIVGVVVVRVRKLHHGWLDVYDARVPQEVRDYLDLRQTGNNRAIRDSLPTAEFLARVDGRVTFRGKFPKFKIEVSTRRLDRGGIKIGSIVEGVDEEAETQELVFPFMMKQFDEAIQAVEDDCDRIWRETHGCEACDMEDEFGRRAINPDCTVCHGEGTVI